MQTDWRMVVKGFETYMDAIGNDANPRDVLSWIHETFPSIEHRVAWGQPVFTDYGTFCIGFSVAKGHLVFDPEGSDIRRFSEKAIAAGYTHREKLMQIKEKPVDYVLLDEMIRFNVEECRTFWKKCFFLKMDTRRRSMEVFGTFLDSIDSQDHRRRTEDVFNWVHQAFPSLVPKIAWNQPMFTDHGTFIIAFSVAKSHLAISPDVTGMKLFSEEIRKAGYSQTKNLFRITWETEVDYSLLGRIIRFNIEDKKDCQTFWKKL